MTVDKGKTTIPPPDGGYGWVVVIAAFCCFNLIGTHLMAFGLLYRPVVDEYGTSYALAGFVGSISLAFAQLPAFIFAALVERRGARLACMLGSALAGSGFLISAFVTNVFVLYFTFGVLTGCGIGLMYNANVVIVLQYFDKKKGLASAVSTAGVSTGAILGAWIIYYGLNEYGLSNTMLLLGGYDLLGLAFGTFHRPLPVAKKENEFQDTNIHDTSSKESNKINRDSSKRDQNPLNGDAKVKEDLLEHKPSIIIEDSLSLSIDAINNSKSSILDFSLLKNPVFFVCGFATFLMNFGMVGYNMHSPSRAIHYGVSDQLAAYIPQATGAAHFFSQVFFGLMADCACTDRKLLYAIAILVGGIVEVTMMFCVSFYPILFHAMLLGICNGAFLSVQSTVLVDLLSVDKIAKSQALLGIFIGLSALVVTPFAGYLYDSTENYNIPFAVTGSVQILGGIMLTAMFLKLRCR